MDKKEAYKIVFYDLILSGCGIFQGKYDALKGSKLYMYGVSFVMEYIAQQVSEGCYDDFSDLFMLNMVKSEEIANAKLGDVHIDDNPGS